MVLWIGVGVRSGIQQTQNDGLKKGGRCRFASEPVLLKGLFAEASRWGVLRKKEGKAMV